jgi:hypothetical protein
LLADRETFLPKAQGCPCPETERATNEEDLGGSELGKQIEKMSKGLSSYR